jgi:haloalkane dehalogenase
MVRAKQKPVDISKFRHLYPFESHFIDIRGFRYHYIDEGEGEPLVMIHGNPTWSFYYRKLVQALSPQFRTLAVDHIGCGLSDKPSETQYDYRLQSRIEDLEYFIDFIGLQENITLVMHDWGGMIGMAYAVRHMESIGRVIVLNTAAFLPPQGKKIPVRLQLVRNLSFISRAAVLGFNLFARGALIMAAAKRLPRDVKSGLIAPYSCRQNRLATLKFVTDIPLSDMDPSYHLVREVDRSLEKLKHIPMLVCWGMKDFVFDKAYLAEWKRRFPDARVHAYKNAGHYVLEDVPDEVIADIKKFLLK